LVNEDAETLGAGAAADEVLELAGAALDVELELELELDDELPHADTATLAITASAAKTALLFSKCTLTSSSGRRTPPAATMRAPRNGCHNGRI
jgi:hypothetical protein